jgi:hypothetical protein
MSDMFLIEYNHNGAGVDYYEAMAASPSREGAEVIKKALSLKYRNGKLKIRPMILESGAEEKYDSWLRNLKEEG